MTTTCRLCGAPGARRAGSFDDFEIRTCGPCGVMFRSGGSDGDGSLSHGEDMTEEVWSEYERLYYPGRAKTYARLLDLLGAGKGRRILDVGSAAGWFMEAAMRRGFEPVGMEPSVDIAPAARRRTGKPVQIGILEQAPYAAGAFDVVTLFDVLEHTTDPRTALGEIGRMLGTNGTVALRVPDHDGLLPRVSHWMASLTGGRYVQAIRLLWRFHRWGFNRRSLERLLRESGFEVLSHHGEDAQDLAAIPKKHWARNRLIVVGVRAVIAAGHFLGMRDEIVVVARKTA